MDLAVGLRNAKGATRAKVRKEPFGPVSAKREPFEWPITISTRFEEVLRSTVFLNCYGIPIRG